MPTGLKIKIGLLGAPDSTTTQMLMKELRRQGLGVDFVVFWKPDCQGNLKRLRFMIRKYGILAAAEAVWHGVFSAFRGGPSDLDLSGIRVHEVLHHNSPQCRSILQQEQPDVLLLSTNAIIKKEIFDIPRLGTLNAHPAWLPGFRGFGSSHYQLLAGYHLAVSVHRVDEGVDSGPIYAREMVELDLSAGIEEVRRQLFGIKPELHAVMARLIIETSAQLARGEARPLETSHEENRLFKGGMPKEEQARLDEKLRSPGFKLRRIDAGAKG